jgi:hypothetical protein
MPGYPIPNPGYPIPNPGYPQNGRLTKAPPSNPPKNPSPPIASGHPRPQPINL